MPSTYEPFKDYIVVPKVNQYPPEYNLINTGRYQIVQAIIDHDFVKGDFKPSNIYYIFYDRLHPANTKLLEYEDLLTKDYYNHLFDTVKLIESTWKEKTGLDVNPEIDLYKLLQLNVEEHLEKAKILFEHQNCSK